MTKLTHNSFLCIYFNSLHVSNNLVLIIRRINCINTTSSICHSVSVTIWCAVPILMSGRWEIPEVHSLKTCYRAILNSSDTTTKKTPSHNSNINTHRSENRKGSSETSISINKNPRRHKPQFPQSPAIKICKTLEYNLQWSKYQPKDYSIQPEHNKQFIISL